MKEFFAAMFLVVGFAAAIGFAGSRGGSDIKAANRAELWNELKGRDTGPAVTDSRFSRPRGVALEVTSPVVAITQAAEMAGEVALFASDMGERISPEAGLAYLMSGAVRLIADAPPAAARKPTPEVEATSLMIAALRSTRTAEDGATATSQRLKDRRAAGSQVATSPWPTPRPDAEANAVAGGAGTGGAGMGAGTGGAATGGGGVLSAALDLLAKAGLSAMASAEGATTAAGVAGRDKFADHGPPDPVALLARRYRDRAPGLSI
ncbi:MAG: hypothetical protein ACJA1L_001500 [Paracoccaceae bacterium]|jgi:hypothetical protein